MDSARRIFRKALNYPGAIVLASLALAAPALAATNRYVATTGVDGTTDCSSQSAPCFSIGYALTRSASGDTIIVAPGAYPENVTVNLSVTIQGSATAATTVTASNAGTVFTINGGASVVLDSLTITAGANASNGGGIANSGTLTVVNSTISGNSTPGAGGAIYNNTGTVSVVNSTVSGNSAMTGAAIYNNGGAVSLVNSTISGNPASSAGGGGVANNGTMTAINTIIANNAGGDCALNAITSNGHNLDDDGSCFSAGGSDFPNTNPRLGVLQNNGGPTSTMALLFGSPALDAGDDAVLSSPSSLTTDQRGLTRKSGLHVDIGAFEVQDRYVATTGSDTTDGGANDCATLSSPCLTIGNALTHAASFDIVNVAPGTYMENLIVSQNVIVQGSGSGTIVNGNKVFSVFIINSGLTVVLNHLTITNGNADSNGGGVANNGFLTIVDSTISGNLALAFGGGVYNNSGANLIVDSSTLSGNLGTISGGGLFNQGLATATVLNSTFSGNTLNVSGGGAGIANGGILTVSNSTFSGNFAGNAFGGGAGGAINSTFGAVTITNSTFFGNSAVSGGGGALSNNGNTNPPSVMTVINTIVAGSPAGGDCSGAITSSGHNLDDDGTCFTASTDLARTNPELGPLQNNGGPTATMALLSFSPALNAGDDAVLTAPYSLSSDQRGFPRKSGSHVDIGAYELQVAGASATAVSSSIDPAGVGQIVTLTATITNLGAPELGVPGSGTVTFQDGSNPLGTSVVNGGVAIFSTPALSAGTHAITATYGGNATFSPSESSSISETVNQASTTTSLSSAANPSVIGQNLTLTATVVSVSGIPTGTVMFLDGAATLGTGTLNAGGSATLVASALTSGSHSLTAVYNGSTNFAGSSSAALVEIVNPAQIVVTVSPGSQTVTAGNSATYNLTVTTDGSLTAAVTFSCIGLPQGASCSFNPASVSAGASNVPVTLTVSTTARTSTSSLVSFPGGGLYSLALGLPAICLLGTRRRQQRCKARLHLAVLCLLLVLTLCLAGCGGGATTNAGANNNNVVNGTPAGTYSLAVASTSGSTQSATPLTLVVQ